MSRISLCTTRRTVAKYLMQIKEGAGNLPNVILRKRKSKKRGQENVLVVDTSRTSLGTELKNVKLSIKSSFETRNPKKSERRDLLLLNMIFPMAIYQMKLAFCLTY
jgi:hypothetical protein